VTARRTELVVVFTAEPPNETANLTSQGLVAEVAPGALWRAVSMTFTV
jgi:hypothetical protein